MNVCSVIFRLTFYTGCTGVLNFLMYRHQHTILVCPIIHFNFLTHMLMIANCNKKQSSINMAAPCQVEFLADSSLRIFLSGHFPSLPSPPPPSTHHSAGCHGELLSGVRIVRSWEHPLAGDRRAGALHRQLCAGVPGAGAPGRQGRWRPGTGQWWQGSTGQSLILITDDVISLVPYLSAAVVIFSTGSGSVSGLYHPEYSGRVQPASKHLPILVQCIRKFRPIRRNIHHHSNWL